MFQIPYLGSLVAPTKRTEEEGNFALRKMVLGVMPASAEKFLTLEHFQNPILCFQGAILLEVYLLHFFCAFFIQSSVCSLKGLLFLGISGGFRSVFGARFFKCYLSNLFRSFDVCNYFTSCACERSCVHETLRPATPKAKTGAESSYTTLLCLHCLY